MKIPVCEPYLNGNELKYITDAVKTGWISSKGTYIDKFESEFSKYLGIKHSIGTINGTVALHLALLAIGIKPGDEVIIPDFTMISSAFAVCYCGAIPVFVDADMETWNIDTEKIEEKISSKTKAIMAVHIYGHSVDMDTLHKIAEKYDLKIIEDAAEAHGAEYKGKKCGNISDVSAFSFYANKILTTGEGGVVCTNSDEFADKIRYYKNLCFPLDGNRNYQHKDIGFNYRMSNIHAALGLAQVEKADEYLNYRRNNAKLYNEMLADTDCIQLPVEKEYAKNCYWMYGIVLKENSKISRDEFMKKLSKFGIDTRAFFYPMHRQVSLINYGANCNLEYPISDYLSKNGLYLPSASNLSEMQIEYICEKIKEILE